MSSKTLRWLLVASLALAASFGSVARADVRNASATNVQEGDNENETNQSGASASGDAVAGSVVGVVSAGDTSVDATNRSEDVEVTTGDATGTNNAASFTGLTNGPGTALLAADLLNPTAVNVQEGDNDTEIDQDASASTGDGVGGQVIGVVTSAGGSADVVAANTTLDAEIETGDADAFNDAVAFVGLTGAPASPAGETASATAADIVNASATHVQEGDNEFEASQDARAATGDGVGGQVLGVVSAGDASIDATNRSEDVEVETGEAFASNDVAAFVGLTASTATGLSAQDIFNPAATNVQEGDNEKSVSQNANAASGDAVGGQVAGVVTSAGGSADLVLASTSEDVEAESGESDFVNEDLSFTGLNAHGVVSIF